MISIIKEFWENNHTAKNKSILSGCKYNETIDFLKVQSFIKKGNKVLEIGVGLGYVTQGFYNDGLLVSALDISEIALSNVKKYCEKLFLIKDIESIPKDYFDLIICHNVIQHVPTDLLKKELFYCIRSLKDNGIFAMEFISTFENINDTWNENYKHSKNSLPNFYRSIDYMGGIIKECGGSYEMVVNNKCNIGKTKGCHVFHIKNNFNC